MTGAAAEAPLAFQRDRARWSLLEIVMGANSPGLLGQIETEAASWNDPSYFSDLLERKVAQLVASAEEIDWRALAGVRSVALTAGASAPEILVERILDAFAERFAVTVETLTTADESVFFPLPRALRQAQGA